MSDILALLMIISIGLNVVIAVIIGVNWKGKE